MSATLRMKPDRRTPLNSARNKIVRIFETSQVKYSPMKHLILLLSVTSLLFSGLSQTETTVWNGKTYYIYPHQLELQGNPYLFTEFADFREVLKRDDKNRKVVSVEIEALDPTRRSIYGDPKHRKTKSEKQQEKFLRELLAKKPELFYQYSAIQDQNVVPALESIPDGNYIQYYRDLPYLDNNTVRYRNDVVAGVFTVKNNQLDGHAAWYTMGGMLLKSGDYLNGSRNGQWTYYSFQPRFGELAKQAVKENQVMDYLLNQPIAYDTTAESYVYQDGLKNGLFENRFNQHVLTTGAYKNDKESGTWEYRGFLIQRPDPNTFRQTDTLITLKRYTIPDHPVRGKSIIIRDEVIAPEFRYDTYSEGSPDTSLVLINPAGSMFSDDYFEAFSSFYTILPDEQAANKGLELPEETISSYEGELTEDGSEPYYYEGDLSEMDFAVYYSPNRLIDSLGYQFLYEGIYEEHYNNGQLKLSFEVRNGTLVGEDTVFWDNGKAANTVIFDTVAKQYVQHFFDYRGKLYKTALFDEKGELLADDSETETNDLVVIDGLTYVPGYETGTMTYTNESGLRGQPAERMLVEATRWQEDSTFSMKAYFDPATQTREETRYNVQQEPYYSEQAVFGDNYQNVNAVSNRKFQSLRLETTTSGSLYDFSFYSFMTDHERDSVPQLNVFNWMSNYETQSDQVLYQDEQPFSGKFHLDTETKTYRISASEKAITVQLPAEASERKLLTAALKQYRKRGKKSPILGLYGQYYFYGNGISSETYTLFPFTTNFFNRSYASNYESYTFDARRTQMTGPFDKTIDGAFLNGKPEGEWIVKDQFGHVTARVRYVKGELEGDAIFYSTEFPITLTERMAQDAYIEQYHTYVFDTPPEEPVQYVSHREHYRNGLPDGPDIRFNWKGDTTYYSMYRNGMQDGPSFERSKLFYSVSGYESGLIDGIARTYLTIPGRDSILIFDLNFQSGALQGESKTYHTNGKLAKRGFFLSGQPIDDYEAFDTLGFKYQYVKFEFNEPVEEKIWEENQLSVRYQFDWKDSIPFDIGDITGSSSFERLAVDLGLIDNPYAEPYFGRPSVLDKTGIDYRITKYYPNDTIAREGTVSKGKKVGHWKYFSYDGLALYEVNYFDTILVLNDSVRFKSKGILTYLDANGKPSSRSYVIEKVEKYDCSHADHNEERMLYTIWEADSSLHRMNGYVKNYYDNGVLQNEGIMENGLPTGVWKHYDSDGNLNQVGNYKLGKRDGRWLAGDLGNVKNMSEICLNPNLGNLEELIAYQEKLLDISVIYYGMGTILKREYYGINMNNEEAPENYYGEDEYIRE